MSEKRKEVISQESPYTPPTVEMVLHLQGLNCAGCGGKIEGAVAKLPEVQEASLDFIRWRLKIRCIEPADPQAFVDKISRIADKIEPGVRAIWEEDDPLTMAERQVAAACECQAHGSACHGHEHDQAKKARAFSLLEWGERTRAGRFAIAGTILLLAILGSWAEPLETALFLTAYLVIGIDILWRSVRNISHGQIFDENFLMTIATVGAILIGEYPEGVAVMLFYQAGEWFQDRAVDKSRRSISDLMDIKAEYANILQDGQLTQVEPETVAVGSMVVIRPGEKVPLDGKVVQGSSMLNTADLTGESSLRSAVPGDTVLAGFVNVDSVLTVEVTKDYSNSAAARILEMVENASGRKAPIESFITRFARVYTPIVVGLAALVAILPPLILQEPFSGWIYKALVFLVISCPCALVISIPLAYFAGIGASSRQGVLVKGGNYLDALGSAEAVVFDKTGTLTQGTFQVQEIRPAAGVSETELLQLAAMAEQYSTHPIAESICRKYKESGQTISSLPETASLEEIGGRGVRLEQDGVVTLVGNRLLLEETGIEAPPVEEKATTVYLASDGRYCGYISIGDSLKKDAVRAISDLRRLGLSRLVMLTGDNRVSAQNVASQLGIEYRAELLPDHKVNEVEDIQAELQGKLIFVGDGINDAPVLARADVGVAMGGLGSDAAIEAADVVLMTDEPSKLVEAIKISRHTQNIAKQNIVLALGIKGVIMILSVIGLAGMWQAVFADVGVALLAVLNSIRILNVVKKNPVLEAEPNPS